MRIATVAACMSIVTCSANAAVPCHTTKDGDGYWSWREIDGRRCWYLGRPGKPKTELFWQVAARSPTPASTPAPTRQSQISARQSQTPARGPQAPASSPVLYLQVTPTVPAPGADMLRAQPMTAGELIETPGTVIRDAVAPDPEGCCWPQLEDLPFAERWGGLLR